MLQVREDQLTKKPETPRMAKVPASVNELLLREELIRIVTMYINKFG